MVIAVYLLFGLSVLMAAATSLIGISAYKKVKRGPVQERNGIVILKNPTLYVAVVFTAVWACCFMLAGLAFKDEFPVAAIVISAVFFGVQCLVFAAVQNIKNWKVELKGRLFTAICADAFSRYHTTPWSSKMACSLPDSTRAADSFSERAS